jgi:hypothetical protein
VGPILFTGVAHQDRALFDKIAPGAPFSKPSLRAPAGCETIQRFNQALANLVARVGSPMTIADRVTKIMEPDFR